jgi:hypothetical protein
VSGFPLDHAAHPNPTFDGHPAQLNFGHEIYSSFNSNVGAGSSYTFSTFPESEYELSQAANGDPFDTFDQTVLQQYPARGGLRQMIPSTMSLQGHVDLLDMSALGLPPPGDGVPFDTSFFTAPQQYGLLGGVPQIAPNEMSHQGYVDLADMSASAFAQTGSNVPLATPVPTARQQLGRQGSFQPMPSNDMSLQEIVSPADISALGIPHTGSAAPPAEGNPVNCEHPGCSATFGRMAEMRRHLTTAHRRGPTVRCMFCHYDCPRIDKVRSHMRTMHAEGWRKLMGRSA